MIKPYVHNTCIVMFEDKYLISKIITGIRSAMIFFQTGSLVMKIKIAIAIINRNGQYNIQFNLFL